LEQFHSHLLPGSVPDIELDLPTVGVEDERVHLNPQSCNIFLFELSRQVALDKSGLPDASVADQDEFEFGHCLRLSVVMTATWYRYHGSIVVSTEPWRRAKSGKVL
jgi:hypothetical protein